MLLPFRVAPYHRAAIGIRHGDVVDDVVSEIEALGAMHVEGGQPTRFIVGFVNVAQIDVSHEACSFSKYLCAAHPGRAHDDKNVKSGRIRETRCA